MIYYFPFAKFNFTSTLEDDEIVNHLVRNLEPKQDRSTTLLTSLIMNPEEHRLYEGTYFNYHFNINRVRKNSGVTNPEIEGRIIQNASNSTIQVKMKYKGLNAAIIFMLVLIMSITIVVFLGVLFSKGIGVPNSPVPVLLLLLLYSIAMFRFNWAVRKVKKEMSDLFNATLEL